MFFFLVSFWNSPSKDIYFIINSIRWINYFKILELWIFVLWQESMNSFVCWVIRSVSNFYFMKIIRKVGGCYFLLIIYFCFCMKKTKLFFSNIFMIYVNCHAWKIDKRLLIHFHLLSWIVKQFIYLISILKNLLFLACILKTRFKNIIMVNYLKKLIFLWLYLPFLLNSTCYSYSLKKCYLLHSQLDCWIYAFDQEKSINFESQINYSKTLAW